MDGAYWLAALLRSAIVSFSIVPRKPNGTW